MKIFIRFPGTMRNRGCGNRSAASRRLVLFRISPSVTKSQRLFGGSMWNIRIKGLNFFENSPLENVSLSMRWKFYFPLRFYFTFRNAFLFATTFHISPLFSNFPQDFPLRVSVKQQRRRKLAICKAFIERVLYTLYGSLWKKSWSLWLNQWFSP